MLNRRQFIRHSAAAAAAFTIVPRHVLGDGQTPPSEKLNIAGIGVGGQGGGDLHEMATDNIVALCDVDWNKAAHTFNDFPKAKKFKDYRQMLDKIGKEIDAVMIATPDHMHAPITLAALRAGKHVYVEKPMAHSIEEARVMTRVAQETGLVTQMGNMGHGGEGLRLTKEWIDAGAIGAVKEVHGWSDRPGNWWPQPAKRPTRTPPVPPQLDWNLWLGAAPTRPYSPAYHPFAWRGWFDFGTGALGDMAVHNLDSGFYALDLGAPTAAESKSSELGHESYPHWQIITFEFPAKDQRPPVTMTWYDGGKLPEKRPELGDDFKFADNGILFVGDKGAMVCGGWAGEPTLYPQSRRSEFQLPPKTIPRSIGHRAEWIQACKDRKPQNAKAGFAYSGPFTEALLVGNLATRLQKRIEWNGAAMKATNAPEADRLIHKKYREGFGLS